MIKGGLISPQLVRLGKIVIGEPGAVRTSGRGNTFRPPQKLDHFSVRALYRGEDGKLVEDAALMKRLGKEPKELRIRLPFNDIEANFTNELRSYKGGMLFCSGDGEQAMRRAVTGQKDGKPTYGAPQPFTPCVCPLFESRDCRRFGALRVILEEQQQVGGIYEFRTTSRHSIENILSSLMTIKAHTGGILAWVPLLMKLVPQTVQMPDGGTTKVFVIQIVFDGPPQQLLTEVRDILGIRAPLMAEIRQLEAGILSMPPVEEDAQESRETQNEFYPEATEAEITGAERGEIERPTREQITGLVELAKTCGVALGAFADHVCEVMGLSGDVKLTKKILAETMTLPQYDAVYSHYEALVKQQVEQDLDGDDEEDETHAETSVEQESPEDLQPPASELPAGLQDPAEGEPQAPRDGSDDVPPDDTPRAGLATPAQLTHLKNVARKLGDERLREMEALISDHDGQVAHPVYARKLKGLIQEQLDRQTAAKAGTAEVGGEGS